MRKKFLVTALTGVFGLTACGGGGGTTAGGAGAPALSSKCAITNLNVSSGTQATLTKSESSLSTSMTITMQQKLMVDITTNFESAAADDWIEGYPFIKELGQGGNPITLTYDLNSPRKNSGDRYTKLSVTARLPGNEACVANLPVNILLNP